MDLTDIFLLIVFIINVLQVCGNVCPEGAADGSKTLNGACLILFLDASDFTEAENSCRRSSGFLAQVEDADDVSALDQFMQLEGLNQVWIGAYEVSHNWRWNYNEGHLPYSNWLMTPGQDDQKSCMYTMHIDASSNYKWVTSDCSEQRYSICSSQDNNLCLSNVGASNSYKKVIGGTCYIAQFSLQNWFAASHSCKTKDAALVEITSSQTQQHIVELLEFTGHLGNGYWTGLHKKSWQWTSGSIMESSTLWGDEQPNGQACLSMKNESGTHFFESVSCDIDLPFICEKVDDLGKKPEFTLPWMSTDDPIVGPTTVVSTSGDSKQGTGKLSKGLIGGLVVIVIVLVSLLGAVGICFFCYYRKGKDAMMKDRDQQRTTLYKKRQNPQSRPSRYASGFTNHGYRADMPMNNNNLPKIFSTFTTSETHTSEADRIQNMSQKAKEAVEAGETPPAIRAMKYLEELKKEALLQHQRQPQKSHQLNEQNVKHNIKSNIKEENKELNDSADPDADDAASDFDYSEMKIDIGKTKDTDSGSEFEFDAKEGKRKENHKCKDKRTKDDNEQYEMQTMTKKSDDEFLRTRPGSLRVVKPASERETRPRRYSVGDTIDDEVHEKGRRNSVTVTHGTPLSKRKQMSASQQDVTKEPRKGKSSLPPLPTSKNEHRKLDDPDITSVLSGTMTDSSNDKIDSGILATPTSQRRYRKHDEREESTVKNRRRSESEIHSNSDHNQERHKDRDRGRRDGHGQRKRERSRNRQDRDGMRSRSRSKSRDRHANPLEQSRDLQETLQRLGKTYQLAKDQEQEVDETRRKKGRPKSAKHRIRAKTDIESAESDPDDNPKWVLDALPAEDKNDCDSDGLRDDESLA